MKAPNTTRAMDQALDWLIELDCASAEEHAEFQAWLAADPTNREAFSHAQALWNSNAVAQAAAVQPRPPSVLEKLRRQWKPLATAAVLLLSLTSFSNLPIRLPADPLAQVGERQRLQLANGSKILLNTTSAFSSVIDDRQRPFVETLAVTGTYRQDRPLYVVRSLVTISSAHLHELPSVMLLN